MKKYHRWKSDNDVRLFLMERGLSQREVRKVLPVMRRDPDLVNDVATLAARMQAIADLLDAAVSWYSPEGDAAMGVSAETRVVDAAVETGRAAPLSDGGEGDGSVPLASVSAELGSEEDEYWNRIRNGQGQDVTANHQGAPAPASASASAARLTDGDEALAEGGMVAMRLFDDVEDACDRNGEDHRAAPPSAAAVTADRVEGEGPRLHAYQLVSSEPRLLLLRAEPDLCNRLRFVLDMLPGLRRGWDGRLRKAAPLLAVDTVKLQGRLEGLVEMFPDHVDLQAVLNQAPLLLRHRTETVAAALANTERLIPGLRVDRLLRSAPYVLIQPLDVVEKRLSHLRKVLGLTPSPELEKMRIAIGPQKSSGSDAENGRGGSEGGWAAGVRTLARFANAFPQILTMEPHTVRAKIEGLEELLPGMDALAVVSSRPHLLGFSVRQNVSLKVSGLRALMKPERAEPEESWHEQHRHQRRQASARAGSDLAAAVTRCPSLLTLSSETAARKVEELQEALPPGLDARAVVTKEPRVLALDMVDTVPRKLAGLTRALAAHAPRGRDGDEMVEEAAAQVLLYYPKALRLDPATLAGKLEALRRAGLSSEAVLAVVGGAPKCLSAAAETLEQRVSTLRDAFPSASVDGMLGQVPGLLLNRIDPGARVKVLQELFPSLNPLQLVEGAPMLLALSESTLRAKSEAWRNVLEARVEQSWEQAIAEFPQLLCQGLGRAARVAFLLLPGDSSVVPAAAAVPAAIAPSASPSGHGDAIGAATAVGRTVAIAAETRTMSAATAWREVCRRVVDFERDHPAYPAFLDSLLLAARRRTGADNACVAAAEEDEVRIAVTSEKALGAAMTAAAKGPGGGKEAAAMLLLEGVGVRRDAGGR
eukprot:g13732.t1